MRADEIPRAGRAAGRAGGLRQPRRRARRAGARRPRARRCWPTPASRCTPRKDHVVFERSEVLTASGGALQRVHALQERLAEEARRRSTCRPTRWRATPAALAPLPGRRRPACRRWPSIGFEPTNLHAAAAAHRRQRGAQELLDDFLQRIDALRRDARLPGRQGPELPVRRTCASARCRSAGWRARPAQRMQAGSRGAEVWLSELIWRDFYHQILHHHPRVVGPRLQARVRRASAGSTASTPTRCSPPGARAAPATRWWTRRCTRSTRPATCTTGCAWWWPAS